MKTPSQKSEEKMPESSLDSAETPLKMKLMLNVTQMMEENYPLPMTGMYEIDIYFILGLILS